MVFNLFLHCIPTHIPHTLQPGLLVHTVTPHPTTHTQIFLSCLFELKMDLCLWWKNTENNEKGTNIP